MLRIGMRDERIRVELIRSGRLGGVQLRAALDTTELCDR